MRKVYVATSWRNAMQPVVVQALRLDGHEVYDFRNPAPQNSGFHWSQIDSDWKAWDQTKLIDGLADPLAIKGFMLDFTAMQWADTFVLVQPCGKSAHLEFGWAVGKHKTTIILLDDGEPELMFKMADYLCASISELRQVLANDG